MTEHFIGFDAVIDYCCSKNLLGLTQNTHDCQMIFYNDGIHCMCRYIIVKIEMDITVRVDEIVEFFQIIIFIIDQSFCIKSHFYMDIKGRIQVIRKQIKMAADK